MSPPTRARLGSISKLPRPYESRYRRPPVIRAGIRPRGSLPGCWPRTGRGRGRPEPPCPDPVSRQRALRQPPRPSFNRVAGSRACYRVSEVRACFAAVWSCRRRGICDTGRGFERRASGGTSGLPRHGTSRPGLGARPTVGGPVALRRGTTGGDGASRSRSAGGGRGGARRQGVSARGSSTPGRARRL